MIWLNCVLTWLNTPDQLNAKTGSDQIIAGKPAVQSAESFNVPETVCTGESAEFCFEASIGTNLQTQQYDDDIDKWFQVFQISKSTSVLQCFELEFETAGDYQLRYKIGGGPGGFTVVTVTVENYDCEESEATTAYIGDGAGGTNPGPDGNNAWWYYLDIGDGLDNVTKNVWEGQSNDIGDVTYDADNGTITITFDSDWFLETDNDESVKWYSYADGQLPTNGRPTPGKAPNKGTSLSFNSNGDQYYVIHLDVATCVE